MKSTTGRLAPLFAGILSLANIAASQAGDVSKSTTTVETSTRYGWFDVLDHRSAYGTGAFPEPFLNDDSDLETGEFRFDWSRTALHSLHTDEFKWEIEKNWGPVTFEVEVPYIRDVAPGDRVDGLDNIDLGARVPVFQYVSKDGNFDTTFGVGFEWGIAPDNDISRNGELVPKIFNDSLFFKRFSLQTIVGVSFVTGPGEEGGSQALEYGFTFGVTIQHKELPIPGVQQIIPVFELSGEHALNKEDAGTNSLTGLVGVRINTVAIGRIQPRLGVGYIFPINDVSREDFHSGVFSSFVFEF